MKLDSVERVYKGSRGFINTALRATATRGKYEHTMGDADGELPVDCVEEFEVFRVVCRAELDISF